MLIVATLSLTSNSLAHVQVNANLNWSILYAELPNETEVLMKRINSTWSNNRDLGDQF